MLPSWASTMRLQTGNPKPCPLALVVNNGVKSLDKFSSVMPPPVSSTLINAVSPFLDALIVSWPPSGIACTAFVIRLENTRCINRGSSIILKIRNNLVHVVHLFFELTPQIQEAVFL